MDAIEILVSLGVPASISGDPQTYDEVLAQNPDLPITEPEWNAGVLVCMKKTALAKVDKEHADFLRSLTGGASVEERDTWAIKAKAAEAILKGIAEENQVSMLETEARISGRVLEDMARVVIGKRDAYMALIGTASGLRTKTRAAISQAVQSDEIDAILKKAKTQARRYADLWKAKYG